MRLVLVWQNRRWGGKSCQWKSSVGTLLQQLYRTNAHVLLLAWGSSFCLLPVSELESDDKKLKLLKRKKLMMAPKYLDTRWGFGETAVVVDRHGLLAAFECVFKKHAEKAE